MYTHDHGNISPLRHSRILNPLLWLMRHLEAILIAKAEYTRLLPKFNVDVGLENKKGRVKNVYASLTYLNLMHVSPRRSIEQRLTLITVEFYCASLIFCERRGSSLLGENGLYHHIFVA